MDMTIFKPSTISYEDYGYTKPIRYTEKFLKTIAEHTNKVNLTKEHTEEVIGEINNIKYTDGALKCTISDEINVKGKGISPKFGFDLIDKGEYLEPVNGIMINGGLTSTPRSHIVCNSTVKENNIMNNDDALKQVLSTNAKLERELAMKDSEMNELKRKLETIDDLEKKLNKLQKENQKYSEEWDILKEKADSYDNIEYTKKKEIIDKLTEDNSEKERFGKYSVEDLQFFLDKRNLTTTPKGVSTSTGAGEGEVETLESKEEYSYSEFEENYKNAYGITPEFKF